MPVFVELTTDAFADTFARTKDSALGQRAGASSVRRPLRGLEIKDDTYAILKVIRSDGSEIKLIDSSSVEGQSEAYSNFILQSVREARMEKHQIVETFGDPYIFFFGEAPRFLDVTAVLVDSFDFNWYAEFWENYNLYLRGTKSVEMGARTYMFYDDNIVEGYMLNATATKVSDQPLMAQLQFRLYLTNYQNVTFVGDPNFPTRSYVDIPPDVSLTTADEFTGGTSEGFFPGAARIRDALQQRAELGALLQQAGFGGWHNLSDALRGGLNAARFAAVQNILKNAGRATGFRPDELSRQLPLRSLIADNVDEFTGAQPQTPPDFFDDNDPYGRPEAFSLHAAAILRVGAFGAGINNPALMNRMGMGPYFLGTGVGVFGGAGVGATFGVGTGAFLSTGFRGGINGGLGFVNGFTGSNGSFIPSATSSISDSQFAQQQLARNSNGTLGSLALLNGASPVIPGPVPSTVFGNGVPIQGGIVQGYGVAGGIPGGMSGALGPYGPGTLPQFQGGQSYGASQASRGGYGFGLSGAGAVISVGGAPSAFSTVAAPGTLNPAGTAQAGFFIGPNGNSSYSNTTGIFAP